MSIIDCTNCSGTHYGSVECPYLEKNMGEPCVGCGERTCYCCSDCAIDGAGKVYVCITEGCRMAHERKHAQVAGAKERALAEDDAKTFGMGFVREYPDGRAERIPPSEVKIFTMPNLAED